MIDAFKLNEHEKKYISEFSEWLPDKIIDAHVHCNKRAHVLGVSNKAFNHMLSTYPYFTIQESQKLNSLLHPKKIINSLRFPNVFRGIDHKRANSYLCENSPSVDRVALFGLPEDIPYTTSELMTKKYAALKMYYSYMQPTATSIYEIFKPDILSVAQDLDIPIVLHVPQIITKSVLDIIQLCNDFPSLRITIAHLGSTKFVISGLKDTFQILSKFENIYMDTALNPSADVCELAIKIFGPDRIIYGSDAPLSLLRSIPYIHPVKGQQIVTQFPYHWIDRNDYSEYSHLANTAVHSHWSALNALKTAILRLPISEQAVAKRSIFFENAQKHYKFL